MKDKYLSLSPELTDTAEATIKYFRNNFGATSIKREVAVRDDIEFRPTLSGNFRDHHLLCVEVTDGRYTEALDSFVLSCQLHGIAAKTYIAMPTNASSAAFKDVYSKAKTRGIGLVEVGPRAGGNVLLSALPLSLFGVRRIDIRNYPKKLRATVQTAQDTFLNGDPVKGAATVYEEIEAFTRKMAHKIDENNLWKNGQGPTENYDTGRWAVLLDQMREQINITECRKLNIQLTKPLISRVHGCTPHRNEAAHRPNSREALERRDAEARTRYESAIDLLVSLIHAAEPLRIK